MGIQGGQFWHRSIRPTSRRPSADHLLLAAKHLSEICQGAAIPHVFLGGWTVRLRGGSQETQDVDITVSATMEQFKQVVLLMPRYSDSITYFWDFLLC